MHLMIDLETFDTAVGAPIAQIGATAFDMLGNGVLTSFHVHTIPAGDFNWETIKWWLMREQAAREALVNAERCSLRIGLEMLAEYCSEHETFEGVWSHGASFDVPLISYCFKHAGMEIPWDHHNIRDTRTLFWLSPAKVEIKAVVKHNALHDCIAQVAAVQQAYKALMTPEGKLSQALSRG